jgi:GntR family transcriptional regulator of vanillate catabolism
MPRGDNAQTVRATLALRQLLFDGEVGPGERLVELALVERIGVSRTPLRLALTTLEHEGLVESLPGGGFAVRTFARADVDDAIELRGVVEGTAARFAAERLESPAELDPIRELLEELDHAVHDDDPETILAYVELNDAYHTGLVELAKSEILSREVARLSALPFVSPSALLASYAQLGAHREIFVVAQHQHRTIVDAIQAGHGTRAEEVAREHARISQRNLDLALAGRQIRTMVPGLALLDSGR